MSDKMNQILIDIWNRYKNNDKSSIFDPYAFFIEQKIFIKLDEIGEISELEKLFLIDYMKSGIMNNDEILDYEDLRSKNPNVNLPVVDF